MKICHIIKLKNNLGVKIGIFLFIIVCITQIINFTLNNFFVSKYFLNIENEDINSKVEHSMKIFQLKINELETLVEDYALWDVSYNNILNKNNDETWIKENFTESLPDKYGIDLIVMLDKEKKVLTKYGLNNINEIINDNKILRALNYNKYNDNTRVSGFKKYNGDIYIISSCPIYDINAEGVCQGILIMGKKVSSSFIEKIKEDYGIDIFISYHDKFILNNEIRKEVVNNKEIIDQNRNNKIFKLNNSKIIGTLSIRDISGNTIGNMNVIQSRDIFLSTQNLTQRNILVAMILSIIIVLILGYWFKNIIVMPIRTLEAQIKKMEEENLLKHVNLNREAPNEISNLADSFNHLIDSLHEHKMENQQLKLSANTDFLTSVYNHKYYFESIKNKINENHKCISLMFCDLDKFKITNDTFGHEIGDFILKETAKIISDQVKEIGSVYRYGGEEFLVILCDYTCQEAYDIAEKIRRKIIDDKSLQKYADYFPISISVGIACYPENALDGETLIKKADCAMYYSKQSGRNQCNIYNNNMNVFSTDNKINNYINREFLIDSALALAEAVDAKDPYTGKHSKMVSKYSILLAEKLGLSEKRKNSLRIGALLHDCGKIGIPDNIINKPEKLSDYEFKIIKNHTLQGYNIIKHITKDEEIIDCVRSHHERWDGKGYPDGIGGHSIHLFARIVCIADVYHAMTSDRPYRKALTQEKALEEIKRMKGTQFDPKLADVFINAINNN
ncbi:diguanylate cyclase [Anaerovorax odorimutans]|uniref:diguanylate cyclase n=1 Tax=Anaerovorax odorimutans TaxID=109327 RepID=UPI000400C57C|nr:diguanylate cyclase [Anaerovorax odorimutans]